MEKYFPRQQLFTYKNKNDINFNISLGDNKIHIRKFFENKNLILYNYMFPEALIVTIDGCGKGLIEDKNNKKKFIFILTFPMQYLE